MQIAISYERYFSASQRRVDRISPKTNSQQKLKIAK